MIKDGSFDSRCPALLAFLQTEVLLPGPGRVELARLLGSIDTKEQALGAHGYAALAGARVLLNEGETRAALERFGAETRKAVVESLAVAIRTTVAARPGGSEEKALRDFFQVRKLPEVEGMNYRGREDSLLAGETRIPMALLLAKIPGLFTLDAALDAVLDSDADTKLKCELLEARSRDGFPAQVFPKLVELGCPGGGRTALTAMTEKARETEYNAIADAIPLWPFDDIPPYCLKNPELKAPIASALREVVLHQNTDAHVRLRALDDLLACDPEAARNLAKDLTKDAAVGERAQALIAPPRPPARPPRPKR